MSTTLTSNCGIKGELPCPVCSEPLQARVAKTKKPYFVCNPCGVQLFVRRAGGIERLKRRLKEFENNRQVFENADTSVAEVESRLRQIDALKMQIKRLEERMGAFFQDRDLARARDALKKRLEREIKALEAH